MNLDPQTLYITGALLTALLGFGVSFWRASWWLRDEFQQVMDTVTKWMDLHEEKDQARHEDNLMRFTKIETKLDIAINNGKH